MNPPVQSALGSAADEFWEAAKAGEFRVPWCDACDDHVWPPRNRCTNCLAVLTSSKALPPSGTVYSFTVIHRPAPGRDGPNVLAYVEIDGGPTVLSNIVGTGSTEVGIGDRVHLEASREGVILFRVAAR